MKRGMKRGGWWALGGGRRMYGAVGSGRGRKGGRGDRGRPGVEARSGGRGVRVVEGLRR